MKSKIMFIGIVLVVLLLTGCSEEFVPANDTGETNIEDVVNGNNQFAFDLYSQLSGDNVFFSPYSISSALAMTYEGAEGETKEQMKDVLGFVDDSLVMRSSFASLYNTLNTGEGYELSVANALWLQKDYGFVDGYLDVVLDYYRGEATELDFFDASNAASEINGWVDDNTNGKIDSIVNEGLLNGARMVLTNAIYFKGSWFIEFDESDTYNDCFWQLDDVCVEVDMMKLTGESFGYYEDSDVQVLELKYVEEDLSMLVVLPKDSYEMSYEDYLGWEFSQEEVDVFMPKFEFETEYSLADILSEMGMELAFSPYADFSGMTGSQDLYIGHVIHKAYIDVNEEGTEAAAATAVIMLESASVDDTSLSFKADKPFSFIIKDNRTGSILFMGDVANPLA